MTARPMLSIERLMIWVCTISVSFALGMYVGEEQSAAELKPCPKQTDYFPGRLIGESLQKYYKRMGYMK